MSKRAPKSLGMWFQPSRITAPGCHGITPALSCADDARRRRESTCRRRSPGPAAVSVIWLAAPCVGADLSHCLRVGVGRSGGRRRETSTTAGASLGDALVGQDGSRHNDRGIWSRRSIRRSHQFDPWRYAWWTGHRPACSAQRACPRLLCGCRAPPRSSPAARCRDGSHARGFPGKS
jgi:hypothetical protein